MTNENSGIATCDLKKKAQRQRHHCCGAFSILSNFTFSASTAAAQVATCGRGNTRIKIVVAHKNTP